MISLYIKRTSIRPLNYGRYVTYHQTCVRLVVEVEMLISVISDKRLLYGYFYNYII